MSSRKRLSFKFIAITFVLMASLFLVQPKNVLAKEYSSTVSTNMLDINSSVVAQAVVRNLVGTQNKITVSFCCLPKTNEKIMAVLADENAGGVLQTKFLDDENTVVFENFPDTIKIPAIHLYKQSPTDPDFVLRRENFIASTSYLMPNIKDNFFRYYDAAAEDGSGADIPDVVGVTIFKSTDHPNIYSAALPITFFYEISAPQGITAQEVFAVVIPLDANGNPINPENPHRQWVSTDYREIANILPYLCRFDFSVPKETKTVYIHFYRKSLSADNFICKAKFKTDFI